MDIFNNIFAYDLNSKQKQIFNDLILSEPYFKAIATKDYNEIKNCLADMKIKYDRVFEILDSFKDGTPLTESKVSDLMKVQLLASELNK